MGFPNPSQFIHHKELLYQIPGRYICIKNEYNFSIFQNENNVNVVLKKLEKMEKNINNDDKNKYLNIISNNLTKLTFKIFLATRVIDYLFLLSLTSIWVQNLS